MNRTAQTMSAALIGANVDIGVHICERAGRHGDEGLETAVVSGQDSGSSLGDVRSRLGLGSQRDRRGLDAGAAATAERGDREQ
jgi:hypothetical protein